MTDSAEELRIIAKDGGRLTKLDRDTIAGAAEELDDMRRHLAAMERALTEVQGERDAKVERLAELSKPAPPTFGFRMLPMTLANWNYPR